MQSNLEVAWDKDNQGYRAGTDTGDNIRRC